MKEFNFNTIKNLPIPEQWIENALAIPEAEEQKPAVVPFWRKPRFIALAASLVLVTALSISLFLSMGSKPPIAVKSDSKPDSTQIVWSTDEYGATVATEVVSVPDDGNQNGAHPSEEPSASSQSVENALGGDRTSPTALSGQGGSESASPTTPGDQRGSATRHGGTSQSPTAAPQKPTASTSPVTPDPTAAPTLIETASHETEVAPPVELPTTAPWEPIWDDPTEPPGTSYITASIPWDVHPGRDHNVFCRLETYDGEIIGEGGLFDGNRLMLFLGTDRQKNIYSYQFKNHITIPDELKGEYVNYYIYDIEGNILKSGTCLL